VSSGAQKIEDLQRGLALTRVEFSTLLQRLEQKITALMDGNNIDAKKHLVHKPPVSQYHLTTFDEPENSSKTDSLATHSYIAYLIKQTSTIALSLLSPLTKFAYSLLNLYQHYQWKRPKLI
jgi:hypothetical protein